MIRWLLFNMRILFQHGRRPNDSDWRRIATDPLPVLRDWWIEGRSKDGRTWQCGFDELNVFQISPHVENQTVYEWRPHTPCEDVPVSYALRGRIVETDGVQTLTFGG